MRNSEQIGITAAELMERIETDWPEEQDPVIEETIIIVRVAGKDDDGEWNTIQWRASDPIWTHQLGLLEGAVEGMKHSRLRNLLGWDSAEDDEDEDEDEPAL